VICAADNRLWREGIARLEQMQAHEMRRLQSISPRTDELGAAKGGRSEIFSHGSAREEATRLGTEFGGRSAAGAHDPRNLRWRHADHRRRPARLPPEAKASQDLCVPMADIGDETPRCTV